MFGAGGRLVEVLDDHALGLPPLNTTFARRLMEQTRIYGALTGVRGKRPVDVSRIEELLVRFSQLVLEQIWIREIDVNPVLATAEGVIALDARVLLYPANPKKVHIVRSAIKPYPSKYVSEQTLADGSRVRLRPIRVEDEPLIVNFQESLSEQSVYRGYFLFVGLASRTSHERLTRICFIEYDREMALVAELSEVRGDPENIVGIAPLLKDPTARAAEISIIVSDRLQRRGIGTSLLEGLIRVATDEQLEILTADVLQGNYPMHNLLAKYGFEFQDRHDGSMTGRKQLKTVPDASVLSKNSQIKH